MKTIILIRHAKSSWDDNNISDFERPLNNRGKKDAPAMAKILKEKIRKPDVIISSPAERAFSTALAFSDAFGYPQEKIRKEIGIYNGGADKILDIIRSLPEEYSMALLFGHNPVITRLACHLGGVFIDNMPTASAAAIEFLDDSWEFIGDKSGKLLFFEYPKKYK
jgi:phosphohistidine phosphatase